VTGAALFVVFTFSFGLFLIAVTWRGIRWGFGL
jgi:hypothetical protein